MGPLVIVGTGMAAYQLAQAFRAVDSARALHLFTQDDGACYRKPMLSTALRKQQSPDDLVSATADAMQAQLSASIHTHTQVQAVDTTSKTLHWGHGESMAYGQLVLATGSQALPLVVDGDAIDQIISVNDLTDYRRLVDRLQGGAKRVLIVGAGLVGCEFCDDLLQAGHAVSLCSLAANPLDTMLMPEAARVLKTAMVGAGAHCLGECSLQSLHQRDGALLAALDTGETLVVDVVISAIGLRPRVKLAESAKIPTEQGIVVNQLGQTQVPDVYAIGDCAQMHGLLRFYVPPILAFASAMAQTLAGNPTPIDYPRKAVGVKTACCPLAIALPLGDDACQASWQVLQGPPDFEAHALVGKRLVGFVLMHGAVAKKMDLNACL